MKWTFEYMDEKGTWHTTRNSFKDVPTACVAAGDWLEMCEEHGFVVAVRLKPVE